MSFPLILASSSPRRIDLLGRLGIPFSAVSPDVDETLPQGSLAEAVATLAQRKAMCVAKGLSSNAVVIGSDTLVSLCGKPLGKPRDEDDARAMLRAMSGKTHTVFTGVFIMEAGGAGRAVSFVETADVEFDMLSDILIEAYVQTGEPMDKAGAYGAQGMGSAFVKSVSGSWDAVVGLPLCGVRRVLEGFGFSIPFAVTSVR